jgi:flavin-dependent dehydrogenase
MPSPTGGRKWGRAVRRDLLDAALLDRANRAGARPLQPARVLRHSRVGEVHQVVVSLPGDALLELEARIVIAAHGSWETPPNQEAQRRAHRDSDLLGFKARFLGGNLEPGLMPLVLFRGGYGGLVHVDAREVSLSCCIRRDVLRECRAEATARSAGDAVLEHIARSCRGVREALRGATQSTPWLSAGPIQPGTRALFDDGVFYAGNAAGEAHPLVAEGISMAIQSASLAAQCIRAAGSLSPAALRSAGREYTQRWRRHFAPRVLASSAFARLTMSPLTGAASIAVLRALPGALTLGARWSGKAHDLQPMGAPR